MIRVIELIDLKGEIYYITLEGITIRFWKKKDFLKQLCAPHVDEYQIRFLKLGALETRTREPILNYAVFLYELGCLLYPSQPYFGEKRKDFIDYFNRIWTEI